MPSHDVVRTSGRSQFAVVVQNLQHAIDGVLLRGIARALRSAQAGRLHLALPSGRSRVVGSLEPGADAQLTLNSYSVLWNLVRRGPIGFAESYMAGELETDSLQDVFNYYIDNEDVLAAGTGVLRVARADQRFHRRRRNTRRGSRRNIAAHYDLGNAFYRLWLDPGLTYSSGLYRSSQMSLEAAQQEKYACILDALQLAPGQSVLEIGCGWGGLAEAIAQRAVDVTGITISRHQFEAAKARIEQAGLAHLVQIRFEDYRETVGQFDRIVSIEMIEAVGEQYWPTYFDVLRQRLTTEGKAVIQAITIQEEFYDVYRRTPDFIQRYIFPGGMLPTVSLIRENAERAGLQFKEIVRFGQSYAQTLYEWRHRFNDAWPRIEALGFDDRFRRMWNYYLTYCEVGFKRGTIDVGIYRLSKS